MTDADDLISEVESLLSPSAMSYSSSSAANDIFEGYIFSLVVQAATDDGAAVHYEDVQGNQTGSLVFRTSPGHIFSRVHPYTHAILDFGDCPPLEAHIGVRILGKSGVLHESDVLIIPHEEADICRANDVAPKGSRCILSIECKFYASSLPLGLARGFVGLHADLGTKALFAANVRANRVEKYLSSQRRNWENGVVPESPYVPYLKAQVRETYKIYRAMTNPAAFS